MKGLFSNVCAAALAVTTAFAVIPASAGPLARVAPAMQTANANLIQVDSGAMVGRGDYRWDGYRGWRHGDRDWRRHHRHRHYRHRHDNDWVGPAIGGLVTGAIIGGALSNSYRGGGGNAHVQWCYNRYRSYRAYDNTYQPYNGPRRQCISPY